jgi:ribonuclease T
MPNHETYISVDVETAGPNPGSYSLLSIGACLVYQPQTNFYIELQPVHEAVIEQALSISKLDLAQLKARGTPPKEAMTRFAAWVSEVTPTESQPVFVAFNAPFDWMFVNDYFDRYLGTNPFGHKALDIKAFYMGLEGVPWSETNMNRVSDRYLSNQALTHHALQDAIDQAEIFRKLLAKANLGGEPC